MRAPQITTHTRCSRLNTNRRSLCSRYLPLMKYSNRVMSKRCQPKWLFRRRHLLLWRPQIPLPWRSLCRTKERTRPLVRHSPACSQFSRIGQILRLPSYPRMLRHNLSLARKSKERTLGKKLKNPSPTLLTKSHCPHCQSRLQPG